MFVGVLDKNVLWMVGVRGRLYLVWGEAGHEAKGECKERRKEGEEGRRRCFLCLSFLFADEDHLFIKLNRLRPANEITFYVFFFTDGIHPVLNNEPLVLAAPDPSLSDSFILDLGQHLDLVLLVYSHPSKGEAQSAVHFHTTTPPSMPDEDSFHQAQQD